MLFFYATCGLGKYQSVGGSLDANADASASLERALARPDDGRLRLPDLDWL